jgi:hypothetical protein
MEKVEIEDEVLDEHFTQVWYDTKNNKLLLGNTFFTLGDYNTFRMFYDGMFVEDYDFPPDSYIFIGDI